MRHTGRIAITQALWALRVYWKPAVWIAVAGTLALAIVLPVLAGATRLKSPPVPPSDFGIEWTTLAVTPAAVQQRATSDLEGMLINLAVAVLLVAAITIAALSVTRAASRGVETSVCRALGATRWDLISAALVEGVVLLGIVIVLAVPAGLVGGALARATWPGMSEPGALTRLLIAIGAIGGVIVGGALFSAASAVARHRGIVRTSAPHRLVVPAFQVGISLAVLVAASRMDSAADTIMTPSSTLLTNAPVYEITSLGSHPGERSIRYGALLDRLTADSSVDAVSLTSAGTVIGLGTEDLVLTECGRCFQGGLPRPIHSLPATLRAVSADTFRANGWNVVEGRGIVRADDPHASRVAVVNEWLALRHFDREGAVGHKVYLGRNGWYTVVGVVRDAPGGALGSGLLPSAAVYVSSLQHPPDVAELLVRPMAGHSVDGLVAHMKESLGSRWSVELVGTVGGLLTAQARLVGYLRTLMRLEGYAALVIALLGTIAVMHLWVQDTLPELAIHRAVGATRGMVLRFLVVRAAAVAVGGVFIGLWLNIMVSGFLDSVLGRPPSSEFQAIAVPALAFVGTAVLAVLYPARTVSSAAPSTWLDNN